MTNKLYFILLFTWFIILALFCFTVFPAHDSFYYWTWSQNLHLSYADGPPLIAYTIRLFTKIFGNTTFSINFLGVVVSYVSLYYLFKISMSLSGNKKVAQFATLLYAVYPFVTTRFIYINMTYDCLESLFYLIIVYYTILFISNRAYNLWLIIGCFAGLSLLSKYSAVVLFLAIFVFFVYYRRDYSIFKSWQLYLGIIICLLIFSPVLYWNYAHDWVSFKYQLNSHKWVGESGSINSKDKYGLKGVWFYLSNCIIATYHILLLILIIAKVKFRYKLVVGLGESFLAVLFIIFFVFWLYISYSSHVGLNYSLPVLFILIYFVSKFMVDSAFDKITYGLLLVFSCISIGMMIDHSVMKKRNTDDYVKFIQSGMIQQSFRVLRSH